MSIPFSNSGNVKPYLYLKPQNGKMSIPWPNPKKIWTSFKPKPRNRNISSRFNSLDFSPILWHCFQYNSSPESKDIIRFRRSAETRPHIAYWFRDRGGALAVCHPVWLFPWNRRTVVVRGTDVFQAQEQIIFGEVATTKTKKKVKYKDLGTTRGETTSEKSLFLSRNANKTSFAHLVYSIIVYIIIYSV